MSRSAEWNPHLYVRPLIAVFFLAVGTVGWYGVVNGIPGPLTLSRAFIAVLVNLLGFFALGVARTTARPYGPLRLLLGIAIALSLLTILSMPIPPHRETIGSDVMLAAVILLALSANLLIVPRPRLARGLLVALAVVGVYAEHAVVQFLIWPKVTPEIKTAASTLSFIGCACIVALLLARAPRAESNAHSESEHALP